MRQVYPVAGTGPVCVAHSGGPGIEWAYLRAPGIEEHFTMVYVEPVGTGASGRLDNHDDYRMDTWWCWSAADTSRTSSSRRSSPRPWWSC
ncbi:hypothetical protein ACLQ24_29335 [Micromonospora sp. DT4]|uniref:hypothetical protein n=1 Tax=Micromonospora sp. DT4 TaxID=3393438 RepID=UPI003CFA6238